MTIKARSKKCKCGTTFFETPSHSETQWKNAKYCSPKHKIKYQKLVMPIQNIIDMHLIRKMNVTQIAKDYGVSNHVITNVLVENGVSVISPVERMEKDHGIGMIELYEITGSSYPIADYYPYSRKTIDTFLKRKGAMGPRIKTKIPGKIKTGVIADALSNQTTSLLCGWR